MPPLAAKVVEYAVPTVPDGTVLVVILTGVTAAATVKSKRLCCRLCRRRRRIRYLRREAKRA